MYDPTRAPGVAQAKMHAPQQPNVRARPALQHATPRTASRVIQRASTTVAPDSPRAKSINNAKGSKWDAMNTTVTTELKPPQPGFGSKAVFSLAFTSDRSDMANQLGFDTITSREKSDENLHAEMLVLMEIFAGKMDKAAITRMGISRRMCKYCGLVLTHEGFTVVYDKDYIPTNWTNPYPKAGKDTPLALVGKIPA